MAACRNFAISRRRLRDRALADSCSPGVLEFNNMFASYKGEGTGAVRHMFSHHILKPERTPIEANVWGTPKSSGSFSNLFRSRLLRADRVPASAHRGQRHRHRQGPRLRSALHRTRSKSSWPDRRPICKAGDLPFVRRLGRHAACLTRSVDLVVTDPPFFDNVHYSELADFFHAWHNCRRIGRRRHRTRHDSADGGPGRRRGQFRRQTAKRLPRVPPHPEG